MINDFIYAVLLSYAALFPVLNPLGGSLLFNSITFPLDQQVKAKLARKIALNAFVLLTGSLILGTYILKLFGIQIPIVQLAGGAVVTTRGWMIMNTGVRANSGPTEIISDEKVAFGSAFFPLTLPMTAGPGSIATAITIGAGAQVLQDKLARVIDYGGLIAGVFLSAVTVYLTYHSAGFLMRKMGDNSRIVIMKLSAFITLCIGLSIVWKGVQGLLALYISS